MMQSALHFSLASRMHLCCLFLISFVYIPLLLSTMSQVTVLIYSTQKYLMLHRNLNAAYV